MALTSRRNPNGNYPQTDELIVQNDPGQQVNERHVGGEQRHDVRSVQNAKRVHVHPVGSHPQETEEHASADERSCRTKFHLKIKLNLSNQINQIKLITLS